MSVLCSVACNCDHNSLQNFNGIKNLKKPQQYMQTEIMTYKLTDQLQIIIKVIVGVSLHTVHPLTLHLDPVMPLVSLPRLNGWPQLGQLGIRSSQISLFLRDMTV